MSQRRMPIALSLSLPLVALLALPACKLLKPNSGSEEKSVLVGNNKNSLLLVPDNLLEVASAADATDKPAVCAYRLHGSGAKLTADRLSDKGVTLERFVGDVRTKAPDLFPWMEPLAKFARSLLNGFAQEVTSKQGMNLADDTVAPANGQTGAQGGAETSVPMQPTGTTAAVEEQQNISVAGIVEMGVEHSVCLEAVAGVADKSHDCKEGLAKRLMTMLTKFGKVAAGKVIEIPANVLKAKTEALAAEIEKLALSKELTKSKAGDSRVKVMEELFRTASNSAESNGTRDCPTVDAVLEKYELRVAAVASPQSDANPTATIDPTSAPGNSQIAPIDPTSAPIDPAAPK